MNIKEDKVDTKTPSAIQQALIMLLLAGMLALCVFWLMFRFQRMNSDSLTVTATVEANEVVPNPTQELTSLEEQIENVEPLNATQIAEDIKSVFQQLIAPIARYFDQEESTVVLILAGLGSGATVLFALYMIIKIFEWVFRLIMWTVKLTFEFIDRRRHPRIKIEFDPKRLVKRQQFADYIDSEIRRLNNLESWSHYRFTELEAEVEIEGQYKIDGRSRSGKYRVPSLTNALEISEEFLVLVEGDPGAGKSVALRQVTLNMARKARESNTLDTPIPIYINLKELDRKRLAEYSIKNQFKLSNAQVSQLRFLLTQHFNTSELKDLSFALGVNFESLAGETLEAKSRELISYCQRANRLEDLVKICIEQRSNIRDFIILLNATNKNGNLPPVDQRLVRDFVLITLNRANDRDIEIFIEDEFERGIREGTWYFLFDSFDEIPEVLSSTDADEIIQAYADAIRDFLGGMNKCRGVVASRQYRGPRRLGWFVFNILPLKPFRQKELIQKAGLDEVVSDNLFGELQSSEHGMRTLASNPLFLSLLCEFVQRHKAFPQNTYTVYEEYINQRLSRDRNRLYQRYGLKPQDLRDAAERLAFCMTADPALSLSSTRANLQSSTIRHDLELERDFTTLLDALEFLKLARSETITGLEESKPFTFSHRRFQEYFATSIVLKEPERVTPLQLLTDGRWRETAVVLCQNQPIHKLQPLIAMINTLLDEMLGQIPQDNLIFPTTTQEVADGNNNPLPAPFPWPKGSIHLLSVLQEGFGNRRHEIPEDVREKVGIIVWSATISGLRFDRKWSLEIAGTAPQYVLLPMLKAGFGTTGRISDIAYKQFVRLEEMTDAIALIIRRSLKKRLDSGDLFHNKSTHIAYLSRLDQAEKFLRVMNKLLNIYRYNVWAAAIFFLVVVVIAIFPVESLGIRIGYFFIAFINLFMFFTLYVQQRRVKFSPTSFTEVFSAMLTCIVFVPPFARVSSITSISIREVSFTWAWKWIILTVFFLVWILVTQITLYHTIEGHSLERMLKKFQGSIMEFALPNNAQKRYERKVTIVASLIAACGLALFFVFMNSEFASSHQFEEIILLLEKMVFSIFVVAWKIFVVLIKLLLVLSTPILFVSCVLLVNFSIQFIKTERRLSVLRYQMMKPMRGVEFLYELGGIHLRQQRFRYVQAVRTRGLLSMHAKNVVIIKDLATVIERSKVKITEEDKYKTETQIKTNSEQMTSLKKVIGWIIQVIVQTRKYKPFINYAPNWLKSIVLYMNNRLVSYQDQTENKIPLQNNVQPDSGFSSEFVVWFSEYTKEDKYRLKDWSIFLIDELGLLLEQARDTAK